MNINLKHDNHFCDTMAAAIFKGPTQVGKIAVKYTKAGKIILISQNSES